MPRHSGGRRARGTPRRVNTGGCPGPAAVRVALRGDNRWIAPDGVDDRREDEWGRSPCEVARGRRGRSRVRHPGRADLRHCGRAARRTGHRHDHDPPRAGCDVHGRRLCPRLGQAGCGTGRAGRGPLQRRRRFGHGVLPLLSRACHRRPDSPRSDRSGPRRRSRDPGPARRGTSGDQVAAPCTPAPGDPVDHLRGVPADAHGASPSRPGRGRAGGLGGDRRGPVAGSGAHRTDRAERRAAPGGRSRDRRIPPAADLRGRRGGALGRRGGPRGAGRGDQNTRGHLRWRQGDDPGPPSAGLRLVCEPRGREVRAEPALRRDAIRGRRGGDRDAILDGQSRRRFVGAGEHQHRRQRTHEGAGRHHPPARRRQGDHRGPASPPGRGRRRGPTVARRGRRRRQAPHRLLRHRVRRAAVPDPGGTPEGASPRRPASSGGSPSSATTPAPTTR